MKNHDRDRRFTSAAQTSRWDICALAGGAMLVCGAIPRLAEARSLALVIGNNNYTNVAALNTAVGDARAVGDQLEKMGYIVRRAYNVDQRAMSRALAAFDADLQAGDRAVLFYAGHGFEISDANYLLPTDVPTARAHEMSLVRDASFAVEQVIDDIRQRGVRAVILVLDACRDNPFAAARAARPRNAAWRASMRPKASSS